MLIDFTSGIFLYAGISLLFGMEWNWINLSLAIFFAFFPDSDFALFIILRKKMKLASHHIIHFPLLLIPICFAVGFWWAGYYGAVLFSACVTSHFFHDSFNPTGKLSGIRWLWPIYQNLFYIEVHRITSLQWHTHLCEEVKGIEKRSWWDEMVSRMEPAGPKTFFFLAISIFLLTFFFFWSQLKL